MLNKYNKESLKRSAFNDTALDVDHKGRGYI